MPIIFVGIAITFFFVVTNPMYDGASGITALKNEVASYNNALDTSKVLEGERDQLTAKYNNIDPDNLTKLQTLLPDSVNNIRLILEIQQLASPYGMTLSDVKYDTAENAATAGNNTATVQGGGAVQTSPQNYGVFNLEFTIAGTYANFINFTKSLESNLRIVDMSSISFSSDANTAGVSTKTNSAEVYKYDFKIKTYWLKN